MLEAGPALAAPHEGPYLAGLTANMAHCSGSGGPEAAAGRPR
jgi:hypothetical protein